MWASSKSRILRFSQNEGFSINKMTSNCVGIVIWVITTCGLTFGNYFWELFTGQGKGESMDASFLATASSSSYKLVF